MRDIYQEYMDTCHDFYDIYPEERMRDVSRCEILITHFHLYEKEEKNIYYFFSILFTVQPIVRQSGHRPPKL